MKEVINMILKKQSIIFAIYISIITILLIVCYFCIKTTYSVCEYEDGNYFCYDEDGPSSSQDPDWSGDGWGTNDDGGYDSGGNKTDDNNSENAGNNSDAVKVEYKDGSYTVTQGNIKSNYDSNGNIISQVTYDHNGNVIKIVAYEGSSLKSCNGTDCYNKTTCSNGYDYRNGDNGYGCYGEPIIDENGNKTCAAGSYDDDMGYCFTTTGINGNQNVSNTCPDGSLAREGDNGYGCYSESTSVDTGETKTKSCDSGVLTGNSSTSTECSDLEQQGYICTETGVSPSGGYTNNCVLNVKKTVCPSGMNLQEDGTCFSSQTKVLLSEINNSGPTNNSPENSNNNNSSDNSNSNNSSGNSNNNNPNIQSNPQTGNIMIFVSIIMCIISLYCSMKCVNNIYSN